MSIMGSTVVQVFAQSLHSKQVLDLNLPADWRGVFAEFLHILRGICALRVLRFSPTVQ